MCENCDTNAVRHNNNNMSKRNYLMNSAVFFFPDIHTKSRPHRVVDMSLCLLDTIIGGADIKFDDDDNRFPECPMIRDGKSDVTF